MLFCQAYPIHKMVPLDRLASADPCLGKDFSQCPLFKELVARLHAAGNASGHSAAGQLSCSGCKPAEVQQ